MDAASVREAASTTIQAVIVPASALSISLDSPAFDQVVEPAALRRAARQGMGRIGGPGVDGVTWRTYRAGFRERIEELSSCLRSQCWSPAPVRAVTLSFPDKNLEIVVPTVEDRIVHRAIRNALEPAIAATCASFVFGWVPRRPWAAAVAMARDRLRASRWVVDADVARVTVGARVDEVLGWLRPYTTDERLLNTTGSILASLPQPLAPGSGLTPMLTNLRLMPVDSAVNTCAVVRYTDNYCIFATTEGLAQRASEALAEALAASRLAVNERKSCLRWNPDPAELFMSGCSRDPDPTSSA